VEGKRESEKKEEGKEKGVCLHRRTEPMLTSETTHLARRKSFQAITIELNRIEFFLHISVQITFFSEHDITRKKKRIASSRVHYQTFYQTSKLNIKLFVKHLIIISAGIHKVIITPINPFLLATFKVYETFNS